MVQSTSHTKPTRLSASLRSGCYLGLLLLVPLRQRLDLRFLVVPRFRCYSVTVNRTAFPTHQPKPRFLLRMPTLYLLDYTPI